MRTSAISKIISCFLVLIIITSCKKEIDSSNQDTEEDIYSFISEPQLGVYVEDISGQIKDYKLNNPRASDGELDRVAVDLLRQTGYQGISGRGVVTDMEGYINGKLNGQEKALYNSNKAKALICMADGKMAISFAEKNYKSGALVNGNGDAFRHAIWNFMMTMDLGSSFAKKWSDAHEYGAANQPKQQKMDLFNNSVGRDLGRQYPNTLTQTKLISRTKEWVRNGNMIILVDNRLVISDRAGEK